MPHNFSLTDITHYNLKDLDLITINAAERAVLKTIKDKVVEWECMMHSAIQQKDPDLLSANAYKSWATAGELLRYAISYAVSGLFLEVLHSRTAATPFLLTPENTDT